MGGDDANARLITELSDDLRTLAQGVLGYQAALKNFCAFSPDGELLPGVREHITYREAMVAKAQTVVSKLDALRAKAQELVAKYSK